MQKPIKITPDENGRALIRLYGVDYDVTELADKKGRGVLKLETADIAINEEYPFQILKTTNTDQYKVDTGAPVEAKEAKPEVAEPTEAEPENTEGK